MKSDGMTLPVKSSSKIIRLHMIVFECNVSSYYGIGTIKTFIYNPCKSIPFIYSSYLKRIVRCSISH